MLSYVVSSGLRVHTIPRAINGIEIIPIIPKIVKNCDSETSGLLIIHGRGNEITIQITLSKIINFAFAFLLFINNITIMD
jgi:hypothetical protein